MAAVQTNGANVSNGHGSHRHDKEVQGKQKQNLATRLINEISPSTFSNEGERAEALLATYALLSRLETPWETIVRLCMGQVGVAES